ncbi:MobA/MobL family protein [Sporomusa acidovorans]|uniref:MobA/MobL family protein n=1 Tax=Sporomusa acidovorans TaxID=112900 RepID=UPI00088F9125|nr:MobA/MobL family protein [Sporomusa acidovorans]OZC19140.1 mobilization protein A [Sporomusa acidovorans DSM 3132]SDD68571.1 MobA/MobL family protein [Sporomusa acidovorans]
MALYHFTIKDNKTPGGRIILASDHAEYNHREGKYANLDQKRAGHIAAADHLDYIARQENYSQKEGFICGGHHLPAWANNSPKTFFQAADAYETSAHTYKEIEFALQSELTLEQNLALAQEFINKHLGTDYYYSYAIHNKLAAMGDGEENLHCHLMFSPRKLDALEIESERQPRCFFQKARRLYTRKDGSIVDRRRDGGCAIAPIWNKQVEGRNHLLYLREDFAKMTNAALEKYGHADRVDHRSYRARRQEAAQKGDALTERLFSLEPEKHIGPTVANTPDHPLVIAIKERRALRKELSQLIESADRLQKLQNYKNERKSKRRTEQVESQLHNTSDESPLSPSLDLTAAQKATDLAYQSIRHFGECLVAERFSEMGQQERAIFSTLKDIHRNKQSLSNTLEAVREKCSEEQDHLASLQRQENKTLSQQIAYCESALTILQCNEDEALLCQALEDCTEQTRQTAKALRSISPLINKKDRLGRACLTYLQQASQLEAFEQAALTEISLQKEELKKQATVLADKETGHLTYPQAIRKAQEDYIRALNHPDFLSAWQKDTQVSENLFSLKRAQKDIESRLKTASSPQETATLLAEQQRLENIAQVHAAERKQQRGILQEIRKDLNTPKAKSYVTRKANALLLAQKPQQDAYRMLQDKLSETTDRIRQLSLLRLKLIKETALVKNKFSLLPAREAPQEQHYTAQEVQGILRTAFYSLRAEQTRVTKEIHALRPLYISEKRAQTMALYRLVDGRIQTLKKLKKELSDSERKRRSTEDSLLSREHALTVLPKPRWYDKILSTQTHHQYRNAQIAAKTQKMHTLAAAKTHAALKERISCLEKEIEQLTATPQAKEKLSAITAGILKKNQAIGEEMQHLTNRQTELRNQEKEMVDLLAATNKQVLADHRQNIRYSAKGIPASTDAVSLIARSFTAESAACAAVARITEEDNYLLDSAAKTVAEREEKQRKTAWEHDEF